MHILVLILQPSLNNVKEEVHYGNKKRDKRERDQLKCVENLINQKLQFFNESSKPKVCQAVTKQE